MLPDDKTLECLYWMEELSFTAIAKRYDVPYIKVLQRFYYHGIPYRKRIRAKAVKFCTVEDCDQRICEIKIWRKGRYQWGRTTRCVEHQLERMRTYSRDWQRRHPTGPPRPSARVPHRSYGKKVPNWVRPLPQVLT